MSNKTTSPNKIKLDPVFNLPKGAEDLFVYSREISDADGNDPLVEQLDDQAVIDVTDEGGTSGGGGSGGTGTPDVFTIVKQTLRRTSGGQQVVDVVISIPSVPYITDYDVQVVAI